MLCAILQENPKKHLLFCGIYTIICIHVFIIRRRGETGRRNRLKICRGRPRIGSIPIDGTRTSRRSNCSCGLFVVLIHLFRRKIAENFRPHSLRRQIFTSVFSDVLPGRFLIGFSCTPLLPYFPRTSRYRVPASVFSEDFSLSRADSDFSRTFPCFVRLGVFCVLFPQGLAGRFSATGTGVRTDLRLVCVCVCFGTAFCVSNYVYIKLK